MSSRYVAASVAVTAIIVVTVWLTDLSFQRAILLAPVLVIGVGAAAGLLVFWSRVVYVQVRDSPNRRLLIWLGAAFVALVVVLTVLGVELPREGG